MTESINQTPMTEPLTEQKKKRPICQICKEDHTYMDWSDALITFVDPIEHFHLGCLQIRVRELTLNSKLATENVISAIDSLTGMLQEENVPIEKVTNCLSILNAAVKNLGGIQ
jgi:hypothetical protein